MLNQAKRALHQLHHPTIPTDIDDVVLATDDRLTDRALAMGAIIGTAVTILLGAAVTLTVAVAIFAYNQYRVRRWSAALEQAIADLPDLPDA